jgi:cytoskeletal protein RodZ
MANYGADGSLQQVLDDEPDLADEAADSNFAPDPWYRNRVLLALWALAVALVLTLIIYGLVELSRGGEGGGPATTTPSTSHTRSSTTSPTTTTTPSTSSETPPPETPERTREEAPPQNTYSPAPTEPPRHHHHFHLPHLPPGLF